MEWSGEGTVLRRRVHGETAAILDVLTVERGRVSGLLPGGASTRRAAVTQPGARLALRWRARSEAHLGTFAAEPLAARSGLMTCRGTLLGLNAVTALLCWVLPEGDPHPRLARATESLLDAMDRGEGGTGPDKAGPSETGPGDTGPGWAMAYLRWELLLLDAMGFGLDLASCAVTGAREGLAYVSPASGRAVTAAGAGIHAPKLLVLPAVLGGVGGGDAAGGLAQGLALTGHFIETRLGRELTARPVPAARGRLARWLSAREARREASAGPATPAPQGQAGA